MTTLVEASTAPAMAAVQTPTESLIRSWVIVLPLLYFAASGHLEPLSSGSQGASHKVALLIITAICTAFFFKRIAAISAVSLRLKVILTFPILALLSCLWSANVQQSAVSSITYFAFILFAIYISETYSPNGQLDLIMLTGFLSVPISIVMAILVPSIGAVAGGWSGIFGHKQQAAGTVGIMLLTALHWKPNTSLQKTLLPVYCMMCGLMIIMSQSRTGWLITLLGIVLTAGLWLLDKFATKDAFFLTVVTVPSVILLIVLGLHFAPLLLTSFGKDPTLSQRTIIWAAVWDSIRVHPLLGYGYEAFWNGLAGASHNVVAITGWDITQAQNGFLDLWLQLGFAGVAIFLTMLGQAGVDFIRSFRRLEDTSFLRWCVVVIVYNLAYNTSETDLGLLRLPWFLFVLACIGLRKSATLGDLPIIEAAMEHRQSLRSRDTRVPQLYSSNTSI